MLFINLETNICFESLEGMCALFCENRLDIKKSVISFVYLFCPNTGMKFCESYHSNHMIPHRVICHSNSYFYGIAERTAIKLMNI